MIDLHCHILPALDDGAESQQMTLEMLENAAASGVKVVVATSHYSHECEKNYDRVLAETSALAAESGITLLGGMEYDYDRLTEVPAEKLRGIGGSDYILIDMKQPFVPIGMEEVFFRLRLAGRRIVIAHPERLWGMRYAENLARLNADIICQINSGSILGRYGRESRRAAFEILQKVPECCIGGDEHRPGRFRFNECRRELERFFPQYAVEVWMDRNPARIVDGKPVVPVSVKMDFGRKLRWLAEHYIKGVKR